MAQRVSPVTIRPAAEGARREVFTDDLLRWTELLLHADGERQARRRRRDILPEVVDFEGRLVDSGVAPGRMDDPCTVEVAWRSDGGPTGERRLSLGELTGRGCWRPLGDPGEEELRRARARVETREIAVARQLLLEEARELSIRISLRPW